MLQMRTESNCDVRRVFLRGEETGSQTEKAETHGEPSREEVKCQSVAAEGTCRRSVRRFRSVLCLCDNFTENTLITVGASSQECQTFTLKNQFPGAFSKHRSPERNTESWTRWWVEPPCFFVFFFFPEETCSLSGSE